VSADAGLSSVKERGMADASGQNDEESRHHTPVDRRPALASPRGKVPWETTAACTLIGLGLISVFAGLKGCGGATSAKPATKSTAPPAVSADETPFWKTWNKPALALFLSGDQYGYLEPCGCSKTQSGGLARRAHLERLLKEQGWPLIGIDAGGLTKRSGRQDQVKFEAITAGLKQLGYKSFNAGAAELRLLPDYLIGQFIEAEGIPLAGMLTSCNVVLFDDPQLGVPKPFHLLEENGVKVGVLGVLGEKWADEVAPAGVTTNITVRPAADAIAAALPDLSAAQPNILVLLVHGSTEEATALAQRFPEFSVVVTTGGPDEADPRPQVVGKTLVLQTGDKGKQVGVLGFFPGEDPPLKWELVTLDNRRFDHDDRMTELMRQYQQQLKDLDLYRSPDLEVPHPSGLKYVGAEDCGKCHTNAYAKWKESKHAQAYTSLTTGRKDYAGEWVPRLYDPECLCCHVTGWEPQKVQRFASGFFDEATSAHLLGQQCENCHGPGSRHSELEWKFRKDLKSVAQGDLLQARQEVKLTVDVAKQKLCIQCHDDENSPGFKFEEYWEKVRHPWKN
jgi:hypothetical protein